MNIPVRPADVFADIEAAQVLVERHPYLATCNCDDCFEAWLAMPDPTPEEREAMAHAFSAALFPVGKGELVTDWPKVSFPDLDAADNAVRDLIDPIVKGALK